MAFLTLSEVRSKARSNKRFGLESRDILEEQFDSFNQYKTYDIFLSHAFLDAEAIDGLRIVLEEAGFTCYGGVNSPYVWLKVPDGMTSWEFFDELLEKANVVGTPGSGFGPHGEGYFRLTAFGTKENTIKAIERIKKVM